MDIIRYHNPKYSGTPSIPISVGDRLYAQDFFRNFRHTQSIDGEIYRRMFGLDEAIIEGLIVSQGAGHTLDITAGFAYGKFNVTIPHPTNAWAIPPDIDTQDIVALINVPALIDDMAIPSAVTDGATTNYVKIKYTETDGNTRARAKKAGTYAYEVIPSYTVTVDAVAPTSYEVCLETFTSNGATITFLGGYDTRVYNNIGSIGCVIATQNDFNLLIQRTSANAYKIRDDVKNVHFKYLSGGYLISGILKGGDTWGVIKTNNCTDIHFEGGTYINVGDTASYMEINTDDCNPKNVYIKGTGTVAVAVAQSFLLNAFRVKYENCKTSHRYSSSAFAGFRGSTNTGHNIISKYNGCLAWNLHTTNVVCYGFITTSNLINCYVSSIDSDTSNASGFGDYCSDMTNCYVYDVDVTGGYEAYGFYLCSRMTNCYASAISGVSGKAIGFQACYDMSNCYAILISATTGNAYGFYGCTRISNGYASNIYVTLGNAYGFKECHDISNGYVEHIDITTPGGTATAFKECNDLINCYAFDITVITGGLYGFGNCTRITNCYVQNITATSNIACGFNYCYEITSCYVQNVNVTSGYAIGFDTCLQISSSYTYGIVATTGTSFGFKDCERVSSSYADSCSANSATIIAGFNNCIGVVNCRSVSNVNAGAGAGYGFYASHKCQQNSGTGNKTATYNTSYADAGAVNACADTAAGGYNS